MQLFTIINRNIMIKGYVLPETNADKCFYISKVTKQIREVRDEQQRSNLVNQEYRIFSSVESAQEYLDSLVTVIKDDHNTEQIPCNEVTEDMTVIDEAVDHPQHYGGEGNPYEAIKVIEVWNLGFCLGNAVKYISRAGKKGAAIEDLKKAVWYLQREIEKL